VILDVGAGTSPYREFCESWDYTYVSHDFNGYLPSAESPGLQNAEWDYAKHDYVCDILEIPDKAQADVVLCTEVLEHIPDPVRAFQKISALVRPGGTIIVTVPFMSLMHQAPFWFQSGLSPFWFEYWAREGGLEITSLDVQGDFADSVLQHLQILFGAKAQNQENLELRAGLQKFLSSLDSESIRKDTPSDILESGGFCTFFVGHKPTRSTNS
jgi:SAM-dependent methyltransferase